MYENPEMGDMKMENMKMGFDTTNIIYWKVLATYMKLDINVISIVIFIRIIIFLIST